MARYDRNNRAEFWNTPEIGGIGLLRAAFATLSFAPHVHEELVVAVTEAGAGRFTSAGTRDVLPPRSVVVFNPGVPHEGGVLDARGWNYRALYIGTGAFRYLSEAAFEGSSVVPYFAQNALADEALAERILAVHQTLEEQDARLTRESALLATLVRLLDRHAKPRPKLPRIGDEQRPIRRVVEVMNARLAEDLSVTDLAAVARMSEFHFIRAFHKAIGLPPHAYLTQLRLRAACGLLRQRHSLADAAVGAGFYDQSHLTKHFKRTYGITPAQYAMAQA